MVYDVEQITVWQLITERKTTGKANGKGTLGN